MLVGATQASASAPAITITKPLGGSLNTALPSFTGTSDDALDPITLGLYAGSSATTGEPPVQAPLVLLSPEGSWAANAEASLPDGQYTALAQQTNGSLETGSASITFTVDTAAPEVSIDPVSSPTTESAPELTGGAGTLPGDDPSVTVTIYEGSSAAGNQIAASSVPVSHSAWSYVAPELRNGTYTAQAIQADEAGNQGVSAVTFTVSRPPPAVSLTAPVPGIVLHQARPSFGGSADSGSGEHPTVTVKVYAGSAAAGTPVQTLSVTAAGGHWSTASHDLPLPDGIYTAIAEQTDMAGNVGRSTADTFAIETGSPTVTLQTSQLVSRNGHLFTDATPTFSGTAGTEPEDASSVAVEILSGDSGEIGTTPPVRTLSAALEGSPSWSTGPIAPLSDGTYTAQAQQQDFDQLARTGYSLPSIFTVDADPPHVTLRMPSAGASTTGSSQAVAGSAGTAEGDLSTIDVQLFIGASTTGQSPLEAVSVHASAGAWSASFGGLSPGTYTARAEQRDDVANTGYSAPVTFTVAPGPAPAISASTAPAPPIASFQWFPPAPHVGEPVSLVSTSSDAGSAISSFAWSLTPGAPLLSGLHVLATSFATPGAHVVRLRVLGADGQAGEVSETVPVSPAVLKLMQPFPVVRIAGTVRSSRVKIKLFTVQAPVGATLRVSCRGYGCPPRPQAFVVAARSARSEATVVVSLSRFERTLGAGALLEIRVAKAGQIGKYTSFTIRHGKLPLRRDTCLAPTGIHPIACPSS